MLATRSLPVIEAVGSSERKLTVSARITLLRWRLGVDDSEPQILLGSFGFQFYLKHIRRLLDVGAVVVGVGPSQLSKKLSVSQLQYIIDFFER